MVGLALEGGGARGAAHVGVLRALEEAGLRPNAVAGTSAGSIVAAGYALRGSLEDVEALLGQASRLGMRLLDLNVCGILCGLLQALMQRNITLDGIFKGKALYKWLDRAFAGKRMTDVSIPLAIPAVDLCCGDVMAFASGDPAWKGRYLWNCDATLAQAVRASCSIPIVFRPVELGETLLVDGGVLENLPVTALMALGMHKVLGVLIDVEGDKEDAPDDILGIGVRTIHVMQRRLAQFEENTATALLRVTLPEGSGLFSMDRLEEYAQYGYDAAQSVLPKLRRFFRSGEAGRGAVGRREEGGVTTRGRPSATSPLKRAGP